MPLIVSVLGLMSSDGRPAYPTTAPPIISDLAQTCFFLVTGFLSSKKIKIGGISAHWSGFLDKVCVMASQGKKNPSHFHPISIPFHSNQVRAITLTSTLSFPFSFLTLLVTTRKKGRIERNTR